jgi:hypothetical protein
MIDTCLTVVVVPVPFVASIVVEVPDDAFPVTISTVDSVEVIATGATGSAEVVFPLPPVSEVLVLVAKGDPGDAGEDGRSAYQVAVDNGFVGNEAAWLASLEGQDGDDGEPGENAQHVILTLAAYLALPPETQMDGRWYIIPKTS